MTNQEIFNKVAQHLLTQKEKSVDGSVCKYRDSVGRMCAVGCLIPDELYDPSLEGMGAGAFANDIYKKTAGAFANDMYKKTQEKSLFIKRYLVAREVGIKIGLKPEHKRLLEDLQNIHDNYPPDKWAQCLSNYAKVYQLDTKVLSL